MLLFTIGVGNLSVQVLILLLLDLVFLFFLLLFIAVLVPNQRQFTLLLHAFVDLLGQFLLVFLFDAFDLLPCLVLDALTLLFVALDHLLDLETEGLFLGFQFFALENLVAVDLLHKGLVGQVCLTHEHFKLLQVLLLLVLQVLVAIAIGLALLVLVLGLLVEQVAMVILPLLDFLLVLALHISGLLLDLFHLLASLEVLLLHLSDEVFLLLFVASHECGLLLLTVTLLSLDRLNQVANLLLQLISLLLLDEDLS